MGDMLKNSSLRKEKMDPFTDALTTSSCLCGILIIAGIIIFILIVAWLIGGGRKKTEIHYIQQQPQQDTAIRYCPNCGRGIPFDVKICPYCEKRF